MTLSQVFGKNVRRIRLEKGLTIEGLANDVGLSYSYVGEMQRGKRNPTLKVVERVAKVLGVRPVDLLGD